VWHYSTANYQRTQGNNALISFCVICDKQAAIDYLRTWAGLMHELHNVFFTARRKGLPERLIQLPRLK
jgi:hypothetical protein